MHWNLFIYDKEVLRPRMFDLLGNGARLYLSKTETNAFNSDCRLWNPSTEPNLQNKSDGTFTFDSILKGGHVNVGINYWADVKPELRNRTIPGNLRNRVNPFVYVFLLYLFSFRLCRCGHSLHPNCFCFVIFFSYIGRFR